MTSLIYFEIVVIICMVVSWLWTGRLFLASVGIVLIAIAPSVHDYFITGDTDFLYRLLIAVAIAIPGSVWGAYQLFKIENKYLVENKSD